MSTQAININEKQRSVLKNIVAGKADPAGLDGRTIRALENRGLVKTSKSGVKATPLAKKILN